MTPNGYFFHYTNMTTTNEWFHTVLNYIGPNNGEGIQIYLNSINIVNVTELSAREYFEGNANMVLGRVYNGGNYWYGSVQVDELYFFDRILIDPEIGMVNE